MQQAPLQDPPSWPSVDARLRDIFRQTFGQDDLEVLPESVIHAMPGFDSIHMVSLLLAIEEVYGVILQANVVRRLMLVSDLTRVLESKSGNAPGGSR